MGSIGFQVGFGVKFGIYTAFWVLKFGVEGWLGFGVSGLSPRQGKRGYVAIKALQITRVDVL